MSDNQVLKLEDRTGARGIESEAIGLHYLTHKNDPDRIAIAAKGIAILTREQAEKLVEELPGVLEQHFGRE